jgi:hypothetical protein
MIMKPTGLGLLVTCLIVLGACSDTRSGVTHANRAAATAVSPSGQNTAPNDSTTYPYDLWIGRAVNHVDREVDASRIRIEFIRWSDGANGRDALFRATNPGKRPVLVWNVRQQVCETHSEGAMRSWETRESDYPGRGWERATIPAGGSVKFPMLSPTEDVWRVCLLYSREVLDSQEPNRPFGGTYESIGPSVREADEPQGEPGAAPSYSRPTKRSGNSGIIDRPPSVR